MEKMLKGFPEFTENSEKVNSLTVKTNQNK